MSDPERDEQIILQVARPESPNRWKDEISLASFAVDPAYRAEALRLYRAEGNLARMVRVTTVTEVLDE